MFSIEKKVLNCLEKNILIIVMVVVTLLGLLIRYSLRNTMSGDAKYFLLPWYTAIKDANGLQGLGQQVGDYNMPYQLLIALMTYLPIKPLHAYKLLSCSFDFLLAFAVNRCVYYLIKNRTASVLAYLAVILSPVVFLNSSAWAQCDSIFTAFFVLSILALWKEKYISTFILFGLAFAFKLQAIFILPVYLFVYFIKKKFSILYFGFIPLVMFLAGLPNIIMGRKVSEILTIYASQTSTWKMIYMNYPSFWALICQADGSGYYSMIKLSAIALTLGILIAIIIYWIAIKVEINPENILSMAFITAFTIVLFLPSMHERYGYPYEILAIILAFKYKKTIPAALALHVVTLLTYGHYLFRLPINITLLAAINFAIYTVYLIILLPQLKKKVNENHSNTAVFMD